MTCVIEDSDEEYLDDPIRLIDSEQKRINVACSSVQESIELSDSDVDIVSLAPPKVTEHAKPPAPARPSSKIVSSTLPVEFFKISRNIHLLNKCLPLRISIVDCDKHTWYYRRKYKNIAFEDLVLDVQEVTNENTAETMKLKIRPVDVESYMKSPIREMKPIMCRQNNCNLNKHTLKGSDETNVPLRNIDYKKNRGLVGLKIVYGPNIKFPSPKIDSTKHISATEKEIPKCDSQNKNGQNINIKRSPKNYQKQLDIEPSSASFDTSNCEHPKKINGEQKSNQSNSESLKLDNTSKVTDEKVYKEKRPSQAKVAVVSKKGIKKKSSDLKTKPNAFEQQHKAESKVAGMPKIEETKNSNVKEIVKASQKNEMKVIHSEKDNVTKKVTKNKPVISQKLQKDAIPINKNIQKVNVEHIVPVGTKTINYFTKDSEKGKLEKPKVLKILQQNMSNHCGQQQHNPHKSEQVTNIDQIPLSVARVPTEMNKQNTQKKLRIPQNKELRSDIKIDNHLPVPSTARPQAKKSFVLTDINDKKIDMFSSQITEGWKNIRQSNPKETLHSCDLTSNNKNHIKTYAEPESKLMGFNEGNSDNKLTNNSPNIRSQTPLTATDAKSKQEKKSKLKLKQELSKHQLTVSRSEHLKDQQAPAPNKKVIVFPGSHYNSRAENNRTTNSQALQEKPSSIHQMLPSLDPRLVRYQVFSQNGSFPKELSSSVSQIVLHKKMASTPLPNRNISPNILNRARIIIKRPNSELNTVDGKQFIEKTQGHGNGSPHKTLKLIPTSTQKGRFVILNKKNINNTMLVGDQNTNFGPYNCQEQVQQLHNMPRQDNIASHYSVPGVPPHKNLVTTKEDFTNEHSVINKAPAPTQQTNSFRQNQLQKRNSAQYSNQPAQPSVSSHSPNHSSLQAPLPNPAPHLNSHLSYYSHNEHAQYYNVNSHSNTNQAPLLNQQGRQNEYGSFYNNNTILNTEQAPPLRNEYESYNDHSTVLNSYQQSVYHKQKPNEHGSFPNQNTILNLDTNTLMQPATHYIPPNVNDMDCAYWNGVNYLGDEWQQGYPQTTQPPPSAFHQYPPPLPEYQHPSPFPYTQHQPPPPTMQHSQPFMASHLPQPSPVPQHPQFSPVSENSLPPAATQYSQLPLFTQHPPPPILQQPPPPIPHHPFPAIPQHPPPSIPQHPSPTIPQHPPPTIPQHPPPTIPLNPPPTIPQHPPPLTPQQPPTPIPQQPTPPLPHPPNLPPPVVTQGSTILGANNNGVVRTINLVTSSNIAPKVVTSNNSLTDKSNIQVNTKSEMLQELSKSINVEGPNLKRSVSDSHKELSKLPNGNSLSGPLAKLRKMEGLATSTTQKALNYGYSPPILPIPTYEKTFEYIAQVTDSMDKTSNNRLDPIVETCNDKNIDTCNDKKIAGILKNKSDFDQSANGDNEEKSVKKISITEYQTRSNNSKQKEKLEEIVKTEIKTESKFDDDDLGYDSDRTVIL